MSNENLTEKLESLIHLMLLKEIVDPFPDLQRSQLSQAPYQVFTSFMRNEADGQYVCHYIRNSLMNDETSLELGLGSHLLGHAVGDPIPIQESFRHVSILKEILTVGDEAIVEALHEIRESKKNDYLTLLNIYEKVKLGR